MKNFLIILLLITSVYTSAQNILIKHTYYEIVFDTKLKQPLYTHYILKSSMLNGTYERSEFRRDTLVIDGGAASPKDYKGYTKIYDKGHLSPNADFRFDYNAQYDSMLYTNSAPQNAKLNRGTWKSLEIYVRDIAEIYDVEVWTGCIYTNSKKTIGRLQVPTYYWKLIKFNNRYEAYKMPNRVPKSKRIFDYKINPKLLQKLIKQI